MKLNLRQALAGLQGRVLALHGAAPTMLCTADGTTLDKVFDAAYKAVVAGAQDPNVAKMKALIDRARNKDVEAITELNALRTQTIDLYVRAMSNWLMHFERVELQPNEQACYVNTYRNPINVRWQGQDGGPITTKAVKAQRPMYVDMRELHTNEIEYPIRDINLGTDVNAAAQATVDIGWDMASQIDLNAFNFIVGGTSTTGQGILGNFTTTGAKLAMTYVANPRINTANLPTTNDIVLSDNGTGNGQSNLMRLAVCRAIIKYCDSWGTIWGAPIRPTGVIRVASSETTGLATEITPTSLIWPNRVAEQLVETYTQFDYMGIRWTLVPDVTLSPGWAVPVLNRPVGQVFVKPAFDEEFVETNGKKNIETRSAMKVMNFAIPEPWRVNFIRIKYSSTASATMAT